METLLLQNNINLYNIIIKLFINNRDKNFFERKFFSFHYNGF